MKTNLEFSKTDEMFVRACSLVPEDKIPDHAKEMVGTSYRGLKHTSRQASKFRRGKGIAYKYLNMGMK